LGVLTVVTEQVVELTKYIDTHYFGPRPHIRGRRVPVATIARSAHNHKWGVAELAYNYTLSEAQVLAALLYYEEHRDEIDALEVAYEAVPIEDWIRYGNDALLLRRNDATSSSE
jgi:uncharacterized protein (DUF433 family)